MDKIKLLLYTKFASELLKLNIGYKVNHCILEQMMDIINFIDYVEGGNSSTEEIIAFLQIYE